MRSQTSPSGEQTAAAPAAIERWYAVHTRSNFEKAITAELTTKSIESYLPVYEEIREWKDRRRKVAVPLFPGYVFARFFDDPGLRRNVLTTTGVVRILGHGGSIEAIPDRQIEVVQALIRAGLPCVVHPLLRTGKPVRVVRGPLSGLNGILARIKKQARLIVSIPLLGQSVATEVAVEDVEVIRGTT